MGDKTGAPELPKEVKQPYTNTNQFAQNIANAKYQDYKGPGVAELDPLSLMAQKKAQNQISSGMGLNQTEAAMKLANQAGNYNPSKVDARMIHPATVNHNDIGKFQEADAEKMKAAAIQRGRIDDVKAGTIPNTNLNQYQNQYTDQVINTGLNDLERMRQMQQQNDKASAIGAHAFGGSREGVQRALTTEAFQRQGADFIANQRAQGFNAATGLASADADRNLQGQLANQGADLSVYGQNAGFDQQANQFNAQNLTQNSQFNAQGENAFNTNQANLDQQLELANAGFKNDAMGTNAANDLQAQTLNQQAGLQANQQQIGASGQLGQLAGQQFDMGNQNVNTLNTFGQQNQANQQAQNTYDQQQWQARQDDPYKKLAALQGATSGGFGAGSAQTSKGAGASNMATKLSDIRLKEDIVTIGYEKGRRWVEWSYKADPTKARHRGVIAQEVRLTDPQAVTVNPAGFLAVDYGKLAA